MPAVRPLRSLRRPEAAPGLTPDPIQQNSLSRSRRGPSRPVTCSYWGTKNVSTQPGPEPDIIASWNHIAWRLPVYQVCSN